MTLLPFRGAIGARCPLSVSSRREDAVVSPPNYSLLLIMVCFWLVFFVVKGQLLKPLGSLMDERDRRERDAREGFTEARTAFDEAVARCESELADAARTGQKERTELRAAGEAVRRARLDAARARGQERLAQLGAELDDASRTARQELRGRAEALSRQLAEHLLGRRLAS
jgi:F0F1-type ATP synthase membrane subunit b/b'